MGFDPITSRMQSVRSTNWAKRPKPQTRIELVTFSLQDWRSTTKLLGHMENEMQYGEYVWQNCQNLPLTIYYN